MSLMKNELKDTREVNEVKQWNFKECTYYNETTNIYASTYEGNRALLHLVAIFFFV